MVKPRKTKLNIEIQQISAAAADTKRKLKSMSGDEFFREKESDVEEIISTLRKQFCDKIAETKGSSYNLNRLAHLEVSEQRRQTQLENYIYKLRQYVWEIGRAHV